MLQGYQGKLVREEILKKPPYIDGGSGVLISPVMLLDSVQMSLLFKLDLDLVQLKINSQLRPKQ